MRGIVMSGRSSSDEIAKHPILLSFRREVGEVDTELVPFCGGHLGSGTISHLT
jgi:hypothetical protein